MANKLNKKEHKVEELNLKPFMNLMITLVPLLIVTAEFSKVATIDIKLPEGRGSQTSTASSSRPVEDPDKNKLLLTVLVSDSGLTVGAKNGFLPTVMYAEYHDYTSKENGAVLKNVQYFPGKFDRATMTYPESAMPTNPVNGKKYSIFEREEINLIAQNTDNNNRYTGAKKGLYHTKTFELLVNQAGDPVQSVKAGDKVYSMPSRMTPVVEAEEEKVVVEARRAIQVANPAEYQLLDLSAYDYLKSLLIQIRERYPDAEDRDNLIVAAENQIVYDKVVQIMDAARSSGIPNISIAKLRK